MSDYRVIERTNVLGGTRWYIQCRVFWFLWSDHDRFHFTDKEQAMQKLAELKEIKQVNNIVATKVYY